MSKIKTYTSLRDLFNDKIITPTEILVIWAKRGKGKSSLAGWFESEFMKRTFAVRDVARAKDICNKLIPLGFNLCPPEDHCVFVDTSFEENRWLSKKSAYTFNPFRWGLPNDIHDTDPTVPCGKYFFDEGQGVFDSHATAPATFVSGAMEFSRQLELFIAIMTQRPKRIHKDVRELSTFFEVVGSYPEFNKFGKIISVTWEVNIIYDDGKLDKYVTDKEESLIDKKIKIKYQGNIYKCYDHQRFLWEFFKFSPDKQFVLEKSQRIEDEDSLRNSFKRRVIDVPETYRGGAKKESASVQKKTIKTLEEEVVLLKKMVVELSQYAKSNQMKEDKKVE